MTTHTSCELFHEDLAAVLDGDPNVIDKHLDHLADCDDCRDLRHEAGGLCSAISSAGADYRAPSNMLERVLQVLDDGQPPVVATAPEKPALAAKANGRRSEPNPIERQAVRPTPRLSRKQTRRRWVPAALGASGLAAAAAITAYVAFGTSDPSSEKAKGELLSATVTEIDSAGTGTPGLMVRLAGEDVFTNLSAKTPLGPGALIRTDQRTRASLALSDGSTITLNRGTEVELDAEAVRTLRLRTGELVAEIAKRPDGPNAIYATANAKVEVLGTRFLLAASGDYSSVRVSRGLVSFSTESGKQEVRPGEEGVAQGFGAPEVYPSSQLAEAMSFSELTTDDILADGTMAGIGELRAFKPGEKRDRDWKLKVAKQKVTVRIAGNIARTEIEQVFQNDSKTTLEGVYKFPLPSDAKIDRLALDVADGFEEGAFVDKQRAAKIWRGVIRKATARKKRPRGNDVIWVPGPWKDPALLEWQRGGRFELRIFPIPKKGSRTIKLAYTQVLPPQGSARRYVYPLAFAKDDSTSVDNFEVDVRIDGADSVRQPRVLGYQAEPSMSGSVAQMNYTAQNFKPSGNFIVEYAPEQADSELRAWTFRGDVAAAPGKNSNSKRGGLDPKVAEEQTKIAADKRPTALFAIRPKLPRWNEARARDFVFVVDSSHSMQGERFSRTKRLLAAAVGEMDRQDRISVIACDVNCQPMTGQPMVPSAKTGTDIDAWLGAIKPAGASNLSASIEKAAALAASSKRTNADPWVVVLSDGASSMGFRSAKGLERATQAAAEKHGVSVSTLGIGSDADDATLKAVARAGGGHFLPWKPGQATTAAALALLETTYGVSLENPVVTLPGAMQDMAPAKLATVRAGQEVLVAARFDGEVSGDVVLRGTVGGKAFEQRYPVTLTASEAAGNAFVPRMWASLDIAKRELEANAEDRPTIVAMSKAYGVLSRYTSLLVLESEAMFKAFGVDRSQPMVRWTGNEGAAESVSSSGLIAYGGSANKSSKRDKSVGAAAVDAVPPRDGDSADDEEAFAPAAEKKSEPPRRAKRKRPRPSMPSADGMGGGGRRGGGEWMRKVYYRTGSISKSGDVSSRAIKAVAKAEAAHLNDPNSREAHRNLVKALSFAGQIDRGTNVAKKWLERDRFDAEALVYYADMLARSGDRATGLRLLSGVVDIAPNDAGFHERLATAYELADKKNEACAHRISAAEISVESAKRLSRAARCLRELGQSSDAGWMVGRANEKVRESAEKLAAEEEKAAKLRGQLQVEASWLGTVDLDVSIVTSSGTRISWMGGNSGVRGSDAMTPGRELLALRKIRSGRYTIEISRSDASDTTPINGSLEVKLLGKTRTIPFVLNARDKRAQVGSFRVRTQSRLVPM